MMLSLVLLGLFVAVTFALWREGLWGSAIMLLNVLTAATFATAWYEAVVAFLLKRGMSSYDYLLDFICIWGLFAIILLALREISDRVSRTKVRFRKPVEMFGCPIVAAATAWIVVCFTAATLHTAAVPRDLIQVTPEARMLFVIEVSSPARKKRTFSESPWGMWRSGRVCWIWSEWHSWQCSS